MQKGFLALEFPFANPFVNIHNVFLLSLPTNLFQICFFFFQNQCFIFFQENRVTISMLNHVKPDNIILTTDSLITTRDEEGCNS